MELTDELRTENLHQALISAQQSLSLAEAQENPHFAIVARMDIASIESLGVSGQPDSPHATRLLDTLKLPSNANTELQCHFYMARLEAKLWLTIDWKQSEIINLLTKLEILASQSDNARLKNRFNAYSLFTRTFRLSRTIDQPSIDKLAKTSKRFGYADGTAISLLVNSVANPESRLQRLTEAKLYAEGTSSKQLQFLIEMKLGTYHRIKKNGTTAITHFEKALEQARVIKSLSYQQQALLKLSLTEKALGNDATASNYYLDYISLKKLPSDPLFKDRIMLLGEEILRKTSEKKIGSQVFSGLRLPRLEASQQTAQSIEVESLAKELAEHAAVLKFQKEDHKDRINSLEKKFASEVFSLRKSHAFASCIAALLGGTMLFLLVYSQFFPRHPIQEIASNKNREFCDELDVRVTRMERMESLGLMAGNVAHDLNNIMVGVLGNAEVIQMANDENQDEFTRERILGIIKSAERATNLSDQMLFCAGKTSTQQNWTGINQLVEQYASVLEGTCKGQQLIFELEPGEVFANLDTIQIEQATLNLVSNAIEASDADGTVVVRTGTTTLDSADDKSLFGTRNSGGEFCFIEVSDEGCGISTTNLEHIFEPFFSDSKVGRGLGLSVVYGVAESHNGFIQCLSLPGEKTTFKILLPLDKPHDDDDQPQVDLLKKQFGVVAASNTGQTNDCKCILVVDDDPSVRELTSQILLQSGYCPHTAANGIEALEFMAEKSDDLLCVLLDIMMPEMPGDEILNAMVEKQLNIPVVVMTGFNGREPGVIESHSHVAQIVRKPFLAKTLLAAIAEIPRLPHGELPLKSTT